MKYLIVLLSLMVSPAYADLTVCKGEYALCAASTCQPTGRRIVANSGDVYPEVTCEASITSRTV